ncbi:MAG TPA: DUF5666 domain-containing protein [Candidatus Angelobacter sp.]|nr:DUF5666 domain-containing protein [Candidatus Angelobacter sp.]
MHRSPTALIALLLMCASLGWAQNNPASPKPGSGVPQTPLPSTNSTPQQTPQTPATETPSTAPTGTVPSSTTQPPVAQPSPTGQQTPASSQENPGTQQSGSQVTEEPLVQMPPTPPAEPKTEILDSSATSGALTTDGHDPILDPAPVPRTTTTLVGGTISGVDRLRNRMTVKVFGGGHWTVNFDERTHIFHNGAETTQLALKKGERVYVDTQLDNNRHDIFARNIRVGVAALPADADGQITDIDTKHNELTLRDSINSVPVRFAVDQDTRISNGQTPAVFKDIKPGALVHVRFAAESPNRGLAREISILAMPGAAFTFAGKITYLDLSRGLLALQNSSDDKNYEIHFEPSRTEATRRLGVGTEVRIVATFEGSRYSAQSVTVTKSAEALR